MISSSTVPATAPTGDETKDESDAIDYRKALLRLNDNKSLYAILCRRFLADREHTPQTILAALERGDRIAAMRLTHTLKSLAGYVGAVGVYESSRDLECALKTAAMDSLTLSLAGLTNELRRAFHCLSSRSDLIR